MANLAIENGVHMLSFARAATLRLLESIPRDKHCYQPFANANHALWIAGHLAVTDEMFLNQAAQRKPSVPETWTKLFGMGSTPQADAGQYPSMTEVQEALHRLREDMVGFVRSLSDEQAVAPLPGDLARFAPNHSALASALAWHEGLHAGQLSAIRKSLGLKPAFR